MAGSGGGELVNDREVERVRPSRVGFVVATVLLVSACASARESVGESANPPVPTAAAATPTPAPAAVEPTTTPIPSPTPVVIEGTVVSSKDGAAIVDAVVSTGSATATSAADGSFLLSAVGPGDHQLTVDRPAWHSTVVNWAPTAQPLVIELDQRVVKALRVSSQVAADPERFAALLAVAEDTVVNAFVFDTKDEAGQVLYDTDVELAHEVGAVNAVYDPTVLLSQAKEHGLYTITRIVTFEDPVWADSGPGGQLPGPWLDAADGQNWAYPLDLAVEACELGFDEVQFDYVRFPVGRLSPSGQAQIPDDEDARAAAISGFLDQARAMLHADSCGVSAAIFGIVMSSATDEGLGQTPETVSAVVDAVSPMLYPSHYSPGWLGFADPNDHPGPVVAHALDTGAGRLAPTALVRPWLQGFYYNGEQVRAQIEEADSRGAGWIIWSANGTYGQDWLPLE